VTSITIRRQGGRVLLYADSDEVVGTFAVCDELGRARLAAAVLRLLGRLWDSEGSEGEEEPISDPEEVEEYPFKHIYDEPYEPEDPEVGE